MQVLQLLKVGVQRLLLQPLLHEAMFGCIISLKLWWLCSHKPNQIVEKVVFAVYEGNDVYTVVINQIRWLEYLSSKLHMLFLYHTELPMEG